jgi:hypothetical protein
MKNDRLDELYQKQWSVTSVMLEDNRPMEVAGVMLAQALRIYKTLLSEKEFDQMMDNISNSRDKIEKFQGPIIQ